MAPPLNEKGGRLTCDCKLPGLRGGDESPGLGPWAPSVLSGEPEEAGQSWVRGRSAPGGDVQIPRGDLGS